MSGNALKWLLIQLNCIKAYEEGATQCIFFSKMHTWAADLNGMSLEGVWDCACQVLNKSWRVQGICTFLCVCVCTWHWFCLSQWIIRYRLSSLSWLCLFVAIKVAYKEWTYSHICLNTVLRLKRDKAEKKRMQCQCDINCSLVFSVWEVQRLQSKRYA